MGREHREDPFLSNVTSGVCYSSDIARHTKRNGVNWWSGWVGTTGEAQMRRGWEVHNGVPNACT
eukprot:1161518-Pelagomonas_calceolata.AAC.14